MITQKVTDKKLAWDSKTLRCRDCKVRLGPESIASLESLVRKIQVDAEGRLLGKFSTSDFPALARQVQEGVKTYLDQGPGVLTFQGLRESRIPKDQWKVAYRILTEFIGEVIQQDKHILEMKEVTDRGLTLAQGGARYSDTRYGGGTHTDGAERPMSLVPDYFGLVCIHQALEGGALQIMSAYSIHNKLLETNPEALKTLYQPFHFDLRGDLIDGKKTAAKPIFFEKDGKLGITYLGDYVRYGHAYEGVPPLTAAQEAALDALDKILGDEELIAQDYQEPGEIIFINNLMIVHARTTFQDHPDPDRKRSLYRTWIRKKA